jgi:predicted RNA-binding protein
MKFWIGVAAKEHVDKGVQGGFCQLCHGKAQPLRCMAVGDWMIYYSAQEKMGEKEPCQQFTAIGQVVGEDVYTFEMAPNFIPFRRDIQFLACKPVSIRPLIPQLSFIPDKQRWGYPFRYGHLRINQTDFDLIASQMLGQSPT